MNAEKMKDEIRALKEKRNAVIVAHNYQIGDVQDIADMVGDSFALSKYCAGVDKRVVVFCGVHFMAESAKILSPVKTILLPEIDAGCPMADMVTPEALIEKKKQHPGAAVVCYVNTSAAVKAECDICCTSSNAVSVIRSVKEETIIFVPDKNLGRYVATKVPEKRIVLWDGYCITHHRVTKEEVDQVRRLHPDARLLVHPECREEVVEAADFVGSTSQIIDFATASDAKKFIIGTEMGVMHSLKARNPHKEFYLLSQGMVCPNMKKTTLRSVYHSLSEMKHAIEIPPHILDRAKISLQRMMEVKP